MSSIAVAALVFALTLARASGSYPEYSCGEPSASPKGVKRTITEIDEFPWTAILIYGSAENPGCGGALISSSYVTTAAHCLTGRILEGKGALKYVRLGEYNLLTDPDCVVEDKYRDCTDGKVDLEPKRVIVHPQYAKNFSNQHHNIGLVELPQHVEFTDFIRPICLPDASHSSAVTTAGTQFHVCGWGNWGEQIRSPVKLMSTLLLVDFETCREQHKDLGSGQICARVGRDAASCVGYSGSPLMYYDRKGVRWVLAGLGSLGSEVCDNVGKPKIYTNVADYVAWIEENSGM